MPIYEYQCRACAHVFDALQKLSDEPLTECPACHEPQLRKLVSAPNFRLKGGGWYETDFKDKNKRNIAGDSASESSGEDNAKSDKSDKSDKAGKSGDSDGATKTAKPDKQAAGGAATPAAAAPKSTD